MSAPAARDACGQTIVISLIIALINVVAGTLIAGVLVRDEFPGKRFVNALIDLPFRAADDRRRCRAWMVMLAPRSPSRPPKPARQPRSPARREHQLGPRCVRRPPGSSRELFRNEDDDGMLRFNHIGIPTARRFDGEIRCRTSR